MTLNEAIAEMVIKAARANGIKGEIVVTVCRKKKAGRKRKVAEAEPAVDRKKKQTQSG